MCFFELVILIWTVSLCLQAVLCRMEASADGPRRSVTLALSKEHNPTIYEERMRIQRAGGTVRSSPSAFNCPLCPVAVT